MSEHHNNRCHRLVSVVTATLTLGALVVAPHTAGTAAAAPSFPSHMAAAGTIRDCIQATKACNWHTRIASGTKLRMHCWADGRTATGRYESARWFYATTEKGHRGYIHSSWIDRQSKVPHCREHIGIRAATWAAEQRYRTAPRASEARLINNNEGRWQGWCKGFATVAHATFGRSVVRGDALETWRTFRSRGLTRTDVDQRSISIGSIVFWDIGDRYGHAAIYVGNGYVMSTQGAYTGKTGPGLPVERRPLDHWGSPIGWVAPQHVGG